MSNHRPRLIGKPAALKRLRYPAVALGELAVAIVNAVLGTELEAGPVRLSEAAHRHMAEDHPRDYLDCIAALPQAIATPTFVG